jgi:hypothetical protein
MFNIPVGVCFNSDKKSVTANFVFISLFGDFELQVSACYGHHQATLNIMNIETLLSEREGLQLHNVKRKDSLSESRVSMFMIFRVA